MKLRLSPLARSDLRGIARQVKKDNGPAVAERITFRIIAAMKHLERFPEMGHAGQEPGSRELGVAGLPFIVIYRLRSDVIAVDRIIHGAMLWPPQK